MTRARDLANVGNPTVLKVDGNTDYVGIGSETPDRQLDVGKGDLVVGAAITLGGNSGIISATGFHGDGSSLTGTDPAGVSTTGFSTFKELAVSGITSITNTTAATSATTGALVVTGGVGVSKKLYVGDSTASTSKTTGSAVFTGGVGIGKSLFVGEGVSIAGTVTYNDVTNIDSVGIVTARQGFKAGTATGTAATVYSTGDAHFIGIITAANVSTGGSVTAATVQDASGGGLKLSTGGNARLEVVGSGVSVYGSVKLQSGLMRETVNVSSTALNSGPTINLSDGMVHYRSAAVGAANVKLNVISSAGINTDMAIGDAAALTVLTAAGSSSHFVQQIRIDGVEATAGVTTYWSGGSVPSDGGGSNIDTYAFNILKTANATYIVAANHTKFSG